MKMPFIAPKTLDAICSTLNVTPKISIDTYNFTSFCDLEEYIVTSKREYRVEFFIKIGGREIKTFYFTRQFSITTDQSLVPDFKGLIEEWRSDCQLRDLDCILA